MIEEEFNQLLTLFSLSTLMENEMDKKFNVLFQEEEARCKIKKASSEQADANVNTISQMIESYDDSKPTIVIKDYKKFFELMSEFISVYNEEMTRYLGEFRAEYSNARIIAGMWERLTPTDFDNVESCMSRHIQFMKDNTFDCYDCETYLGEPDDFEGHVFTVKNEVSTASCETPNNFVIRIYPPDVYYSTKSTNHCYELPIVRYGICEEDGEKVCYIHALQERKKGERKPEIRKLIDNLNKGVQDSKSLEYQHFTDEGGEYYKDNITAVSASSVLSASIFLEFLKKVGIEKIKVASLHPFAYDYHMFQDAQRERDFNFEWNEERIKFDEESYKEALEEFQNRQGKSDLISKNTSEKLLRAIMRAAEHRGDSMVTSFPFEADDYLHVTFGGSFYTHEMDNPILKEMNHLVDSIGPTKSQMKDN